MNYNVVAVALALVASWLWSSALNHKQERKKLIREKRNEENLCLLSSAIHSNKQICRENATVWRILPGLLTEIHAEGCETGKLDEIYQQPKLGTAVNV